MAVRTAGKAVIAGAVSRAELVLAVEHADRDERVGSRVNDAAELEREHDEGSSREPRGEREQATETLEDVQAMFSVRHLTSECHGLYRRLEGSGLGASAW